MTDAPTVNTLQLLADAAERARAADADVRALAARAADEGASYGALGRALGITRQGARKRFPGILATRTPAPPTTTKVPDGADRPDPEPPPGPVAAETTPAPPGSRAATTKVPAATGRPATEPAPGRATASTTRTRPATTDVPTVERPGPAPRRPAATRTRPATTKVPAGTAASPPTGLARAVDAVASATPPTSTN